MIDDRGMQRKDSLDADAKTGFAHGDCFARAAVLAGDANALESLQAFFRLRFLDADVNADRIAGLKLGNVIS